MDIPDERLAGYRSVGVEVPTSELPDPRVDPSVEPTYATSWRTLRRARRVAAAEGPVGRRHDEPHVRKH